MLSSQPDNWSIFLQIFPLSESLLNLCQSFEKRSRSLSDYDVTCIRSKSLHIVVSTFVNIFFGNISNRRVLGEQGVQ